LADRRLVEQLLAELIHLRRDLVELEARLARRIAQVDPRHRESARNLVHYLALRRSDRREIQPQLASLGLSSLGRSEAHVLATVDAVLDALHALAGRPRADEPGPRGLALPLGHERLGVQADALLGPPPVRRRVRILVTLPTEAADDPKLVAELLARGMDCARINCAHDDPDAWARMVAHLRDAQREAGRSCRVLMDLAGPKIRTGAIAPESQILRWRPQLDAWGRVLRAARILILPEEAEPAPEGTDGVLVVPAAWLSARRSSDEIVFRDLRQRRRRMRLEDAFGTGRWAALERTAYLDASSPLTLEGKGEAIQARVHPAQAMPGALLMQPGDRLHVAREPRPGRNARLDLEGCVLEPAEVSCTLPEVLANVRVGERIAFDDGQIAGVVEAVDAEGMHVRILEAPAKGARLGADKGINLPDTRVSLPALTDKDREDLAFVARHADVVGLSFVSRPADVRELRAELAKHGAEELGIVLKIETRRAFEALPDLLLEAMRGAVIGVMIARGDLAVECGYERLAELQEEILWLCEAAHVPVIWATQVLEGLAKKGVPSRAEITDAAMGERAECVMLNKGTFLAEAVRALDDILVRMEAHQRKKSAMLRALHIRPGEEA
jgi:pyruvate kinase